MEDLSRASTYEPVLSAPPLLDGHETASYPLGAAPALDIDMLLAQESWVCAVARHLVRDPAKAEDIAQETMLAALKAPPRDAADPRRLRAWLGRVVHNLAHLETRRRMRRLAREEKVAQSESQRSVADVVVRGSVLDEVISAVSELEEPYRSAIRARYFEGLSTQQIATATLTSDNAVRKRLWRAREKLRQTLDRRHNGERLAWFNAIAPLAGIPLAPEASQLTSELGKGLVRQGGSSNAVVGTATATGWKIAAAALPLLFAGGLVWSQFAPGGNEVLASEGTEQVAFIGTRTPVSAPASPTVVETERPAESDVETRLEGEPNVQGGRRATEDPTGATGGDQESESSDELPVLPVLQGQVLHAIDGLPVGGVQIGLSRDLSLDFEGQEPLAVSDVKGQFALTLPEELTTADLVLINSNLATLRSGLGAEQPSATGGTPSELLFVVADAVEVAGLVLDPEGQPVAGASVELSLSDETYLLLDVPLDGTQTLAVSTLTDGGGHFELAGLPFAKGTQLLVSAPLAAYGELASFEPLLVDIPNRNETALILEFAPLPPAATIIAGIALLGDNSPAVDAHVKFGRYSTRTNGRGQFELALASISPGDALSASKNGWVETCLEDFGRSLSQMSTGLLSNARRDGITLTFTERTSELSGQLQGIGSSKPWIIASADGSQIARIDERDSQGRPRDNDGNTDDGGGSFSGMADDDDGDSSHDGPGLGLSGDYDRNEFTGPPPPPPLGNRDGETNPGHPLLPPGDRDADRGNFNLPGFDPKDHDHWVQGFDPKSGRVFRGGPFFPGDPARVVKVTPIDPTPRFRGRLIDPMGEPIDGAKVRVSVVLGFQPGQEFDDAPQRWESDEVVLTDDDGVFVLGSVPGRFADLRVEHAHLGSLYLPVPDREPGPRAANSDGFDATFVTPRLRTFRVQSSAVPSAVRFQLEDEAGQALLLVGADSDHWHGRLFDGHSTILRASEMASTLVLLDATDHVLVRIPVDLTEREALNILVP